MRAAFSRMLTGDEKNRLHLMPEGIESGYRAKVVPLKGERHAIPEIRKTTNHHGNNIGKWMHRFNQPEGVDGAMSKKRNHKQHKFDGNMVKQLAQVASASPRADYGLEFPTMVITCTLVFTCAI